MLPTGYRDIIVGGIAALRWIGTGLRERARRRTDDPDVWLRVRDAGGLADRLAEADDWVWQTGFADAFVTSQDLAVLAEFVAECGCPSPYRDDPDAAEREAQGARLQRLYAFLDAYLGGRLALEEPAEFPTRGGRASAR